MFSYPIALIILVLIPAGLAPSGTIQLTAFGITLIFTGNVFALPIDNITPIGMVFHDRHKRVLGKVKLRAAFVNAYI